MERIPGRRYSPDTNNGSEGARRTKTETEPPARTGRGRERVGRGTSRPAGRGQERRASRPSGRKGTQEFPPYSTATSEPPGQPPPQRRRQGGRRTSWRIRGTPRWPAPEQQTPRYGTERPTRGTRNQGEPGRTGELVRGKTASGKSTTYSERRVDTHVGRRSRRVVRRWRKEPEQATKDGTTGSGGTAQRGGRTGRPPETRWAAGQEQKAS